MYPLSHKPSEWLWQNEAQDYYIWSESQQEYLWAKDVRGDDQATQQPVACSSALALQTSSSLPTNDLEDTSQLPLSLKATIPQSGVDHDYNFVELWICRLGYERSMASDLLDPEEISLAVLSHVLMPAPDKGCGVDWKHEHFDYGRRASAYLYKGRYKRCIVVKGLKKPLRTVYMFGSALRFYCRANLSKAHVEKLKAYTTSFVDSHRRRLDLSGNLRDHVRMAVEGEWKHALWLNATLIREVGSTFRC